MVTSLWAVAKEKQGWQLQKEASDKLTGLLRLLCGQKKENVKLEMQVVHVII